MSFAAELGNVALLTADARNDLAVVVEPQTDGNAAGGVREVQAIRLPTAAHTEHAFSLRYASGGQEKTADNISLMSRGFEVRNALRTAFGSSRHDRVGDRPVRRTVHRDVRAEHGRRARAVRLQQ